jgi:hypothetical protein
MADLDLPIISRRHELLIVQPKRPIPDTLPWLIDVDEQVHLRATGRAVRWLEGFSETTLSWTRRSMIHDLTNPGRITCELLPLIRLV